MRAGALRGHELVDAVHGLRYVESMIHALELWGLGVRGLVGCRQLIRLYAGGERVGLTLHRPPETHTHTHTHSSVFLHPQCCRGACSPHKV